MDTRNSPKDGEDYISNLHESVITNILSRLQTDEAVRTSVLSKDWKFKWTFMSNFNIRWKYGSEGENRESSEGENRETIFSNFVERVFLYSHNITSFTINPWWHCDSPILLSTLIYSVLGTNIPNISIHAYSKYRGERDIVLPLSLLSSPSPRKIVLCTYCTINAIDANNIFPNLIELHLFAVVFNNGNSNVDKCTMLLTFPVLETLDTEHCKWQYVKSVEINAPALTTFSFGRLDNNDVSQYCIKIIAPRLVKFNISTLENFVIENGGSQVVSADLDGVYNFGKLLKGFSWLEELTIAYTVLEVLLSGHLFPRCEKMTRLTLYCRGRIYPEVLFKLLHAMPTLKYLAVQVDRS